MRRFVVAFAVLLLSPFAAHAAFFFSEIMFDASGTDTKHEWVEVQNSGASVDISGYKFFENGSNHGLTLVAGSATVGAGGYAVIADDAATFLADYPSFSGTLFDAAFSLSNTGETISLRDESLADVVSATYTGDIGALGDGNSLNYLNGSWFPRSPTPGFAAASGSTAPTPTTSSDTSTSSDSGSAVETETPKISVDAGEDRALVVGAGSVFSATAFGIQGEPLATARYVWNFGNAATKEGKTVMYSYTIPGVYTVTVDASSAQHAATDRVRVTVVPADIVVTRANADFVELHNRTPKELDLSLWQLAYGGTLFVLPPNTVIGTNQAIAIPSEVSKLTPTSPSEVVLYYPNGVKAATVAPEVTFVQPQVLGVKTEAKAEKTTKTEPRRLTAETMEERGELVAAAIESTSPEWAWFSFGFLGLIILAGFSALVYIQLKK